MAGDDRATTGQRLIDFVGDDPFRLGAYPEYTQQDIGLLNAGRELVIGEIPLEFDRGMTRRCSLARLFQRAIAEHCPAHLRRAALRRLDNDLRSLQADETAEE